MIEPRHIAYGKLVFDIHIDRAVKSANKDIKIVQAHLIEIHKCIDKETLRLFFKGNFFSMDFNYNTKTNEIRYLNDPLYRDINIIIRRRS